MRNKKGQAAFEYLTTYGWAILMALIAIGALAYFGFLNPSNLLPNKCDFGSQLECVEFRIVNDGNIGLILRNNFGKSIELTKVEVIEETILNNNLPLTIDVGQKQELTFQLNNNPGKGDKKDLIVVITFSRSGGIYPSHNVTGTVFVTVQ